MPKIFTRADVPDELANEWLQHLRDFDTKHPGCHFEVVADAPSMSVREVIAMMQVEPQLSFQEIFDREMEKMETMRKSLREFGMKIGPDEPSKK
jgi:pentose-5-phosphate-3-epimerase